MRRFPNCRETASRQADIEGGKMAARNNQAHRMKKASKKKAASMSGFFLAGLVADLAC
ncbi:hypothetical protein L524_4234 [Bordetella bronchiseptica MBORD762]|nr:hypothetical protein L524_4234 [Bordetella bronchiseptica MBORD762]